MIVRSPIKSIESIVKLIKKLTKVGDLAVILKHPFEFENLFNGLVDNLWEVVLESSPKNGIIWT